VDAETALQPEGDGNSASADRKRNRTADAKWVSIAAADGGIAINADHAMVEASDQ
jgi:hypothetical protein